MIEVVDYRPDWPERFEELRAIYAEALEVAHVPYQGIEHVGSTSVPGLAAKPVIDIDVVVAQSRVEDASAALSDIGFVPRGDLGVAGRYAFITPERFEPSNTYVVVEDSLPLRNHLAVRDTLRASVELRTSYQEVKKHAAANAADINEYLMLKSEVLERVLERAGLSDGDRIAIAEINRGIASRGAQG